MGRPGHCGEVIDTRPPPGSTLNRSVSESQIKYAVEMEDQSTWTLTNSWPPLLHDGIRTVQ